MPKEPTTVIVISESQNFEIFRICGEKFCLSARNIVINDVDDLKESLAASNAIKDT